MFIGEGGMIETDSHHCCADSGYWGTLLINGALHAAIINSRSTEVVCELTDWLRLRRQHQKPRLLCITKKGCSQRMHFFFFHLSSHLKKMQSEESWCN